MVADGISPYACQEFPRRTDLSNASLWRGHKIPVSAHQLTHLGFADENGNRSPSRDYDIGYAVARQRFPCSHFFVQDTYLGPYPKQFQGIGDGIFVESIAAAHADCLTYHPFLSAGLVVPCRANPDDFDVTSHLIPVFLA